MDRGVLRQFAGDARPGRKSPFAREIGQRGTVAIGVERPQFNRANALQEAFHVGRRRAGRQHELRGIDQRFGPRRRRHGGMIVESLLRDLKRHRHHEDDFAALFGQHAAGREAASVTDTLDFVADGFRGIAAQQEIGV